MPWETAVSGSGPPQQPPLRWPSAIRPKRSGTACTSRPASLPTASAIFSMTFPFPGTLPLRRRCAPFIAPATVLGQKCQQPSHGVVVRGIDDTATLAPGTNPPGVRQLRQVEGQGGRRNAQTLGNP